MESFTTITDVNDQLVIPALGEWVDDYDVESIADEITEWRDNKLVVTCDDEEFWKIVESHDITRHPVN